VSIDGDAARHLGRALRARVGDSVTLFNGDGREFAAFIQEVSKRSIVAEVGEASEPATESSVKTEIGLCLSKGDRFDWAIQKATEMGVGKLVPLLSERVDFTIPAERLDKRRSHWQQIVTSACEQCGRVRVPTVTLPQALNHWVQAVAADHKWVLHCGTPVASSGRSVPDTAALLVGPEGGLSKDEIDLALNQGFKPLQLGPRVLRTETAPVAALAALETAWGEIVP
jgi:16S rRNA (uracil1498-N3)-methyltransferase